MSHEDDGDQALERLLLAALIALEFTQRRIGNRHQFGWRYWQLTDDGHLTSPYARSGAIDTPIVTSQCHRNHTPPGEKCSCGIYYVSSWFPFRDTVQLLDSLGLVDMNRVVLTFGVGLDEAMLDPSDDNWGLRPRRTGRYRILGLLTNASVDSSLAERHRCPVVHGINDLNALNVEKLADSDPASITFSAFQSSHSELPETVMKARKKAVLGMRQITDEVKQLLLNARGH